MRLIIFDFASPKNLNRQLKIFQCLLNDPEAENESFIFFALYFIFCLSTQDER